MHLMYQIFKHVIMIKVDKLTSMFRETQLLAVINKIRKQTEYPNQITYFLCIREIKSVHQGLCKLGKLVAIRKNTYYYFKNLI